MPEYAMRFRFPAPDDDHALRRATAMAGTIVADWEDNGVVWEGVQCADGKRVQSPPGGVDPVLVCAAWGGQARPVESDEDMEQVVARVLDALRDRYAPPPPGSDRARLPGRILDLISAEVRPYLSTACEVAQALERAALDAGIAEPLAWSGRMHAECRVTHKFTMQPCCCGCGHPGRVSGEPNDDPRTPEH